jgi:hypothetical protein
MPETIVLQAFHIFLRFYRFIVRIEVRSNRPHQKDKENETDLGSIGRRVHDVGVCSVLVAISSVERCGDHYLRTN